MRVKFLQTTPSSNPNFPFQAGQQIELPRLTADVKAWIRDGFAVVVPDESEAAVLGDPPEQATEPRPRARGSR